MSEERRCSWSDLLVGECDHCVHARPEPVGRLGRRRKNTITVLQLGWRPVVQPAPMRVVYPVAYQEPVTTGPVRHLPGDTRKWDCADYVTALCDATVSNESFDLLHENDNGTLTAFPTQHRTTSPPLLEQLWSAAETSRGMDSGTTRGFGSKPSASIEALDFAVHIESRVHQLLRSFDVVDKRLRNSHDLFPDTISAVRHLGSLVTPGEFTTTRDEAKEIRSWWAGARVITGWDLPAFKPNNTCPVCGTRGGLRIKWPTGICVECRTVWDEDHVGLLVEHVRVENHEDDDASEATVGA